MSAPAVQDRRHTLPLSSAQERLWFHDQLEPGSTAYLVPIAAWLAGPLRIGALRDALAAVAERHEALRTRFPLLDGQPVQLVEKSAPPELEIIDLGHIPEQEREAVALSSATACAKRPFDIAQRPPWRALVVRVDDLRHLLLVNFHHLIVDGRSFPIVFGELSKAYQAAFATLPSPEGPSVTPQYADFTRWHQDWMEGEDCARQLSYWTGHLAGLEPLDLPTDHARPRLPSTRGGRVEARLPPGLVQALNARHAELQITRFSFLLATLAALIHRHTGARDIPIAIPIDNREPVELRRVVGMCINTAIIRTACDEDAEFGTVAKGVQELVSRARANALVPFERVVRAVRGEWGPASPGLANVLFDYQTRSVSPELDLPGITAEFINIDHASAQFDLVFSLHLENDAPSCSVRYATDLFEEDTIRRLLERYLVMLEGIVAAPGRRLHELPLLPPQELALVTTEWNRTDAEFPADLCLHQLFEAQAARTPDQVAIVHEQGEVTYREVNERANRLARRLAQLGAGPEALIGIFLDRSLDLVISIIAALKAGSGYVPFDAKMTAERIAFMAADARLKLVITQARHAAQLPDGTALVLPQKEWPRLAQLPAGDLPPSAAAHNVAYVIYTSGSTGTPKGVVIEHRSAVNAVIATIARYRSLSVDKTLFQSSVTFDSSVSKIFQSICNGGTLYIAPEGADFEHVLDLTERYGIPRLTTTPSELAILNDMPGRLARTIEMIGAAGENLAPTDVDRIVERIPILNIYGPTEATISTTCFKLTKDTLPKGGTVPIGKPIMNYRVYILDRAMKPMPIGCIGELCIGGVGLARGYLNSPELTAQKFVADPFRPGERLYRSGDLARWLPDGNLEFRGRIDQQVKIRGYRIELGEIEAALGRHRAVRQAVVVARNDARIGAYLTAYVVPAPGGRVQADELQDFLKRTLPEYMIPSRFMRLDELPRMISGKVDRAKLPPADPVGGESGSRARVGDGRKLSPYIPLHCQFIAIWERLLGRTGIGITDSFFALGGHSLLAARMMAEAGRQVGRKLPMTLLFEGPTIEHLAAAVMQECGADAQPIMELTPANGSPPFFYLHGDLVGGGYYTVDLARHLGPGTPFYVLSPERIDPDQRPPSVEAMAREHVRHIRNVSPHGPYWLGGYCNGGVVMFEVACQLRDAGEEVAYLGLIDSSPRSWHLALMARAIGWLGPLLGRGHQRQLRWLSFASHLVDRLKGMNSPQYVRAMADRIFTSRRRRRQSSATWSVVDQGSGDTLRGYLWSLAHYRPRRFTGTLRLFLADEAHGRRRDPTFGWAAFADRIEVSTVPGHHFSIITHNVAELAAALAKTMGTAAPKADESSDRHALAGCKPGLAPIPRPDERSGYSA